MDTPSGAAVAVEPSAGAAGAASASNPLLRWSRSAAVIGTLALIVLGLAWELRLAPIGHGLLAWKVLPLAVPLAGLLKHRLYTYRWTSLLIWLYAAEGALRATTERGIVVVLATCELLLALVVFAACAVYVRARLRALRGDAPK